MQCRTWQDTAPVMIVLEGLKGKPVAWVGAEPQISQTQYGQWRDPFLAHTSKASEVREPSQQGVRLARENACLRAKRTPTGKQPRPTKPNEVFSSHVSTTTTSIICAQPGLQATRAV